MNCLTFLFFFVEGVGKNSLKSWLASTSKMTSQQSILISNEVKPRSLVAGIYMIIYIFF
jgi:hypothetical protein